MHFLRWTFQKRVGNSLPISETEVVKPEVPVTHYEQARNCNACMLSSRYNAPFNALSSHVTSEKVGNRSYRRSQESSGRSLRDICPPNASNIFQSRQWQLLIDHVYCYVSKHILFFSCWPLSQCLGLLLKQKDCTHKNYSKMKRTTAAINRASMDEKWLEALSA